MYQRGQISVEFVLMAAIVMLVVVAFGFAIANENELNSVATAVRTGAENGTTYLSLNNSTMQPVRVTSVNMSGTNNVNIKVSFSGSVTNLQQNILTSINTSLTSQGFITNYAGGTQLTFQTSRHNYTISLV
ncbi:MAG: class III signal peptide-containing protein [Methanobacterium sp.]|nr:class III signal peptide-containing protein [Methanobacterium sp.]